MAPLLALPGAAALAGCSPAALVNALVPSGGFTRRRDIASGSLPRQRLDLYEPAEPAPGAPLVVFFYGGGFRSGAKADYVFVAEALAGLGCPVAIPDYRLMPEGPWPLFLEDGAAAVAWLRQAPAAAGRRLVLMGHSAGAFIAIALATDPRWLGPDGREALAGAIGLAGPYDFQPDSPLLRAAFAAAPGGRATAAPAAEAALRGAPPLLLLHGLADDTVSPDRSRELAARPGARARLVLYPGLGHVGIVGALARPVRGLGLAGAPVLEDVAGFLAPLGARPAG
ncbi:hypothetical protein CR165_01505 [Pseudoroseomonas aestuarii]|uniref:Alpha/beta hydrolase fold-3 domain-containing protein n=1 Tax=Teichococcus aestuarii TaxID=568898 RepID=A0A2U1VAQ0_9PROT|nr:hypothetical protein CR165_01505 [Pseudoroseomonas aestuarii]